MNTSNLFSVIYPSSFSRSFIVFFSCIVSIGLQAQEKVLFAAGDLGYECFRIPALIKWGANELFAFAEGRKDNCADFGNVDILMRRSTDGGKTWSTPQLVVDNGDVQAGNATPILDTLDPNYPDGRLFLFYNTGTASEQAIRQGNGRRRGFYITTINHGKTWSTPVNITPQVHHDRFSGFPKTDARTLAFAPGHGLQLTTGPHKGRLVIPANHSLGPPQARFREYRAFALLSDDHGTTWKQSEDLVLPSSNEAMATQVAPNNVLLLVRMQDRSYKTKLIASSSDGGATWEKTWFPNALTTPMCQSAILHVPELDTTFHIGPANTQSRRQLSLWASKNSGRSWDLLQELWAGSAAYSDITYLGNGRLGIFYEQNDYNEIVFRTFNLL